MNANIDGIRDDLSMPKRRSFNHTSNLQHFQKAVGAFIIIFQFSKATIIVFITKVFARLTLSSQRVARGSADPSVRTILLPRVRIPSTFPLFSIYI